MKTKTVMKPFQILEEKQLKTECFQFVLSIITQILHDPSDNFFQSNSPTS